MGLVRIARFADLNEAQVVMSALRSAGIPALLQNEYAGQAYFLWQPAIGDFPILVPQDLAKDAVDFIRQHRSKGSGSTAPQEADGGVPALSDDPEWRRDAARRRGTIIRWFVVILFLGPSVLALGSCVIGLFVRPR
jgi:hypothetical protein